MNNADAFKILEEMFNSDNNNNNNDRTLFEVFGIEL